MDARRRVDDSSVDVVDRRQPSDEGRMEPMMFVTLLLAVWFSAALVVCSCCTAAARADRRDAVIPSGGELPAAPRIAPVPRSALAPRARPRAGACGGRRRSALR